MLPRHNSYGTWPASGEIDIMESRGNKRLFNLQGVNIGTEQISYTSHYGPYFPYNGYANAHYETQAPPDQGYDTAFHVYAVEWTDSKSDLKHKPGPVRMFPGIFESFQEI